MQGCILVSTTKKRSRNTKEKKNKNLILHCIEVYREAALSVKVKQEPFRIIHAIAYGRQTINIIRRGKEKNLVLR